jgi:hypothetical protein
MKNPLDIIKKHFEYLVSEYNYHIEKEEFSPQTMGNAYVTYSSVSVGIRVTIDRSQVLINIGDISDNANEWFDFSDVINFFDPSIESPYIFIEKTNENTTEDIVEAQVKRLASILHKNCGAIIRGELWMKEKIKVIERKRVIEMLEKLKKPSNRAG